LASPGERPAPSDSHTLHHDADLAARNPFQDRHRYAGCAKRNRPRAVGARAAAARSPAPAPFRRRGSLTRRPLTATRSIPSTRVPKPDPLQTREGSSGDSRPLHSALTARWKPPANSARRALGPSDSRRRRNRILEDRPPGAAAKRDVSHTRESARNLCTGLRHSHPRVRNVGPPASSITGISAVMRYSYTVAALNI
jgi:hypothetical protein